MEPQVVVWSDKLSNVSQVGGIETAVLDNGVGRGVRIAWINTGSGLRFKVVIDRAMDIADAFYNQYSLTWLNHPGISAPQPFSHRGADWLRTFGGGLLTTCGLSHVGGPDTDESGERGLHGMISNIPAEIESIIQPDPARGIFTMSITGIVKQTQIFGPSLELRRTISATLGKSSIQIHDEVINRGNIVAPHMLLYHCNFGWPLVDEGAVIIYKGEKLLQENGAGGAISESTVQYKKCPAVQESHNGSGQQVDFIDVAADSSGNCVCGIQNDTIGIAVTLQFPKKQMPWLTNWQHWAKGEYVTGIEPGTHPPIGQAKAREEGSLILMEPGESRQYDLQLNVLPDETSIQSFINNL